MMRLKKKKIPFKELRLMITTSKLRLLEKELAICEKHERYTTYKEARLLKDIEYYEELLSKLKFEDLNDKNEKPK